MSKVAENLTELIGNTPLLALNRYAEIYRLNVRLVGKLEYFNPLGSVKDRIGLAMIERAEEQGTLQPGGTIIEPTSGNTGIGLAFAAAAKGYKAVIVMPDTMSMERRRLLQALGARVILTPGDQGIKASIEKALALQREIPGSYIPDQFHNPVNPEIHQRTTAVEILQDLGGAPDIFVAGVGSGGTVSGVGKLLKEHNPKTLIVAVEPAASPVLTGGRPAPHAIQGIGISAGFIPPILNRAIIDEIMTVSDEAAFDVTRALARLEGLIVGMSSGAAVCAAAGLARRREYEGKTILALLPDSGMRYLSTALFD